MVSHGKESPSHLDKLGRQQTEKEGVSKSEKVQEHKITVFNLQIIDLFSCEQNTVQP